MLSPPTKYPIKVILDTDMANEIDDQYVLPWLLHSPDKFDVKGIHAAPYSFDSMFTEPLTAATKLARHYAEREPGKHPKAEAQYLAQKPTIDKILALGNDPLDNAHIPHIARGPQYGVDLSYGLILELLRIMKFHRNDYTVCRGSNKFMGSDLKTFDPVPSEAADHLIEVAKTCTSDDPLYVVCIAAPTNVASAIVKDPSIQDKIVVIWDGAYPTCQTYLPQRSLNFSLDLNATQVLFGSQVPLVYMPGFYVAQNIKVTLPEMEKWVKPKGEFGEYLYNAYVHNSNARLFGLDVKDPGFSWPIYDLCCLAWLFDPSFVSTWKHKGVQLKEETKEVNGGEVTGIYWSEQMADHKVMLEGVMASPRDILYAWYRMMDKQARIYG